MSQPTALIRWLGWLRAHPRVLALAAFVVLLTGSALAGFAIGSWRSVCRDCPSIAQIYVWEPRQSTKIFAHDGRLIHELFLERRTPIGLHELPSYVPQAFLVIEDRRFYRHGGFDVRGIARAVLNQVRGLPGGGSTITQQLARHMFQEEVGFDVRFTRKLRELHVALQLEQVYSKDAILEAYMNVVNYGHGWHGIETAAQRYFGKNASALDPADAAFLAAVINRPALYSPFRYPDAARSRRNLVLDLMADHGILPRDEAQHWKQKPLPEHPYGADEGELAPYFVEWVRRLLEARYGMDLYSRGLRVFTSLDLDMQRHAVTAMEQGWASFEDLAGYRHPTYADVKAKGGSGEADTPYLQGLFVAMEPGTGEIRALIGGRDFDDSKFNRVIQARRQPGSSFKLFVYTAALASGVPASHVIYDTPIMREEVDGTIWSPRNYSGEFQGPMTLRDALRQSTNVVAVKLGEEIGLETVAQYARRMGIQTEIPRVLSMPIGSPDVIPLQLAEAYATIANLGVRVPPRPILRVEDAHGRVLWDTRPDSSRVLDPVTASLLRDMLQDVVDGGTAISIRDPLRGNLPHEVPAAGKTGTTNDATDVWFIGFTPDLLGAVWFGFDRPARITSNATGGGYAAPVWGDFMRNVYAGDPPLLELPEPWILPDEVVMYRVDRETGMLANEWCPLSHVYTEKYIPGTEPTEVCDLHGPGIFRAPLRGIPELLQESALPRHPTGPGAADPDHDEDRQPEPNPRSNLPPLPAPPAPAPAPPPNG